MADPLSYTHLNKGFFLIASPNIDAGIYFRSVIILCEHSSIGSFGLILNKRLEIDLPEEILNQNDLRNQNVHICVGGPIQPNQMMLLHAFQELPEQTLNLCEGVYLGGDLQFLQKASANSQGPAIRLCFGYCGWGPGQLERECIRGNWLIYPASSLFIFNTPEEKIWQTILRKMGGKYATLSMIPEDLSLN